MILQLRQLFELSGQSLDIETDIPVEELEEKEPYLAFAAPVEIVGMAASSRTGIVSLDYSVRALLDCTCDRCLAAFKREYRYEFSHTLVRAFENDSDDLEDYIECPDNTLDISELALSELKLSMPTKILCKEDCRGLCSKCGQDLNKGSCGCEE